MAVSTGKVEVNQFRFYSADHTADLVVIGSGPGGYVGAIKAAQLGMKVNNCTKTAPDILNITRPFGYTLHCL